VLICGTFTASAGANDYFKFRGSGTSGHPITLLFDSGAVLQAPYFGNSTGGINGNGQSWIVVDGGSNGVQKNTANGTALANHQASNLFYTFGGSNVQVKNLSQLNIYVDTYSGGTGDTSGGGAMGVYARNVSNFTYGPNNTCTQYDVCVYMPFDGGESNLVITQSSFSFGNQAYEMGPSSPGTKTFTNIRIDHNTYTVNGNWDTSQTACGTTSCFHHNFAHPFTNTSGSTITGTLQIYDNDQSGTMGTSTSFIYLENNNGGSGGTMGCWQVFNNKFNKTDVSAGSTGLFVAYPGTGCGLLANNTFLDAGVGGNQSANSWPCAHIVASGWTMENNIFSGCGYFVYFESGGTLTATGQIYYNPGNSSPWINSSSFYSSLGVWQGSISGQDANAVTTNPNLAANLTLQALSSAIIQGANLNGLGLTPLNSDLNGKPRPGGSTKWDSGAYNYLSVTARPSGPPPVIF
jgi:hypothetical protein